MRFISVVLLSISLAACSAPQAARDVLANDRSARDQLTASYAMDLSLTRTLIVSCLQARRTIVVGDIERAIIVDGLVTTIDFHDQALDRVIADPNSANPIAIEVHHGHMTTAQAESFLSDYAALGRLSNARDARRARIASLAPVVAFDAASTDLLAAFDTHAAQVAGLLNELDANSTAFASVLDSRRITTQDVSGSLSLVASTFIKDQTKRDAVISLIGSLAPTLSPAR